MQTLGINHGKSPSRQYSLPITHAILNLAQVNSTDAEGSVHVSFEMTDTACGTAAFDKRQSGIFKKIFVVHKRGFRIYHFSKVHIMPIMTYCPPEIHKKMKSNGKDCLWQHPHLPPRCSILNVVNNV
jgi:hypothetical protein